MNHRSSAFSVLEVIALIAIVAFAVAILLPTLQSVRVEGRSSVCMNNQRQLLNSHVAYMGDHGGWLAAARHVGKGDADGGGTVWWWNLLWDGGYLAKPATMGSHGWGIAFNDADRSAGKQATSSSILICPSESRMNWNATYGQNRHISQNMVTAGAKWRRAAEIRYPSQVSLVADVDVNSRVGGYLNLIYSSWPHDWSQFSDRHGSRRMASVGRFKTEAPGVSTPVGFVDGHVSVMPFEDRPGGIPYHRGTKEAKNWFFYDAWMHLNW